AAPDGLEDVADFLRRLRLHVKRLMLRRPAPLMQKDDRLRRRLPLRALRAQQLRERQPKHPGATDAQHGSAGLGGAEEDPGKPKLCASFLRSRDSKWINNRQ